MNVVEFFDVTHGNSKECRDTTDAEQIDAEENHHSRSLHNHQHHHHHNHNHNHAPATLTHTYMNGWKLENGDISSIIHQVEGIVFFARSI